MITNMICAVVCISAVFWLGVRIRDLKRQLDVLSLRFGAHEKGINLGPSEAEAKVDSGSASSQMTTIIDYRKLLIHYMRYLQSTRSEDDEIGMTPLQRSKSNFVFSDAEWLALEDCRAESQLNSGEEMSRDDWEKNRAKHDPANTSCWLQSGNDQKEIGVVSLARAYELAEEWEKEGHPCVRILFLPRGVTPDLIR